MQDETKNITLEEHFTVLEEIISSMEDPQATLDRSFELYKQGLDHIKAANHMLDDMEKAMLVINSEGNLERF